MTRQDEGKISEIVIDVIKDLVMPILEDHSGKLNGLTEKMDSLTEIVDVHTVSLMELERLPILIGEIYDEVKGVRSQLADHQIIIERLENHTHL